MSLAYARARKTERLEGFPVDQISGTIGAGEPIRVAWIGDSTGAGVGATDVERALPRIVASALGRRVTLDVLAVSGARVSDALVNQQPLLSDLHADWVFVAIGGNDVIHLTPRARFRRELDLLFEGIMSEDPARMVVFGLGDFAHTPAIPQPLRALAGLRARQYDADIRAAAEVAGALYVDIIGLEGDTFCVDPARYHARDRFHPSDDGYGLWAHATLTTLARQGLIVSSL